MTFLFRRSGQSSPGYQNLTPADYQRDYSGGGQPHTLVDVRSPGEFAGGHIPGAVNIPLDQLATHAQSVPFDTPVVVVCASGNRSRAGAAILVKAGHTSVFNLTGGTMEWMMRGWKVER